MGHGPEGDEREKWTRWVREYGWALWQKGREQKEMPGKGLGHKIQEKEKEGKEERKREMTTKQSKDG